MKSRQEFTYLFSPFKLSSNLLLKNRIVSAPMIQRAASESGTPDEIMLSYYSKKADSGLIIAEATMINESARSYSFMPGIFHKDHLLGWEKIVNEVHKRDGKIFIQLWHPGRNSNRSLLNGKEPLAPSVVLAKGKIPWSELNFDTPKEMSKNDIDEVIEQFVCAALNAIKVGFDGVEIHSANGYLLEQFLRCETNKRNDIWGGDPEKNILFPMSVFKEVVDSIGKQKVGIRLCFEKTTINFSAIDVATYAMLLNHLNKLPLAYLHLSSDDDQLNNPYLDMQSSEFMKINSIHPIIACGSYTPSLAEIALRLGKCDFVAFGRLFLKNSNFINQLKR